MPIHHVSVIRYYRDRPGWDGEQIQDPTWDDVEAAIRRMDNYCFPIVQLNPTEFEDSEEIFNVIGGDGRWALMSSDWQYEDPAGSDEEVRLWRQRSRIFL